METLGQTLTLLPKLFRALGIDLCVRFKDTLEGKVPEVPDLLAVSKSLKRLVRKLDGAAVASIDGHPPGTNECKKPAATTKSCNSSNQMVSQRPFLQPGWLPEQAPGHSQTLMRHAILEGGWQVQHIKQASRTNNHWSTLTAKRIKWSDICQMICTVSHISNTHNII